MAFIDEVKIQVSAGRGGRGCVAFHRARHIPLGGPNGGDGGDGGDVRLVVDPSMTTLGHLRRRVCHQAKNGAPGLGSKKTGKKGEHCLIPVPLGTKIYEAETNHFVKDLLEPGEVFVVARGGEGGLGNIHFKSSTNRSPRQSTPGGEGEMRTLRLELQVLADVGLLGFPNAGKSTLLSFYSQARPSIAGYPFTTLEPHLGVIDASPTSSFVMADIPGLIEGASEGVGLGFQFLKHLSRCQCLLHLVAMRDAERDYDPVLAWKAVNQELQGYSEELAKKPQVLVLTKSDTLLEEEIDDVVASFEEAGIAKEEIFVISAFTRTGTEALLNHLCQVIEHSHIQAY